MFKSGCNNRGVAGVKDIVKFIHTFSGYLWLLEKDLVLEVFADTGQEVIECGRDLVKFHVAEYVKPVAGELACNNSHFSLLLVGGNILRGRTCATQWQKFHT